MQLLAIIYFSPAHAVEGDVSLLNMLAFIEEAKKQIDN
jgi:hypothetical protein